MIETTPAGYYLADTIGVRIVHVLFALIWIGVAAATACGAIFTGTGIVAAVIDASREPSQYAAVLPTQMWSLVAITLLTGVVTAGMIVLTWQRLAAAVRLVPASYEPAPTGSVGV